MFFSYEILLSILVSIIIFTSHNILIEASNTVKDFTTTSNSVLHNILSLRFKGCKLVQISPSFSAERNNYSSIPSTYLEIDKFHDSGGNFQLTFFKNQSYKRVSLEDVPRFNTANCALAVVLIPEASSEISTWLSDTTTSPYAPLIRKDEDHFIFVCMQTSTCDRILLAPQYGNKIKYKIALSPSISDNTQAKTVDLYGGESGYPVLISQNLTNVYSLFPDTTYSLSGKLFLLSNPRTKTYFDVDLHPDGTRTGKRGLYKMWLDEMMTKFNFTIQVYESSLSGGSGKQLPNGTWGGTVGDVMYGNADIGAFVGHTYSRHGLIGYSTTITYEWMFFITHKPYTYYTSTAIFRPLSYQLWIGFLISIVIMAGTFKLLLKEMWTVESMISYIYASFIEQDADRYIDLSQSAVRILVIFWLLFALVFSTAYRGKLVSLIAFPMSSWVPWTYEDLAYSDFRIGLHVVGKGGAADSIFSRSSNPVFQILNSRMEYFSNPTDCMKQAIKTDIACVLWKCHFEYGLHDAFTDKFGRSPFHTSLQTTYFLHDGFIWEPRAVFRHHIDNVGWSLLEMGVTSYWLSSDHKAVMDMRFDREKVERANRTLEGPTNEVLVDDGDEGPSKLKLVQFKGLMILYFCGVMFALGIYAWERWTVYKKRIVFAVSFGSYLSVS